MLNLLNWIQDQHDVIPIKLNSLSHTDDLHILLSENKIFAFSNLRAFAMEMKNNQVDKTNSFHAQTTLSSFCKNPFPMVQNEQLFLIVASRTIGGILVERKRN